MNKKKRTNNIDKLVLTLSTKNISISFSLFHTYTFLEHTQIIVENAERIALFIPVMAKLNFQQPLLQSHDP